MALRNVYTLLTKYGSYRDLERLATPGPATIVTVKIMARRSAESPLEGDVSQFNLQFYVEHDELAAAGFPTPPIKGDRVHDTPTRIYTVRAVEDLHDQHGNVAGYRLWARGN